MRIDWQLRAFEDARGTLRLIRGCPLTQLDEFWDCLNLLQTQIDSSDPNLTFSELYTESGFIRQLVDRCLKLCGIEPSWCSLDMMVQLLHHQTNEDDSYRPGILIELNFPSRTTKQRKVTIGFKKWVADNLVMLVGLGLCSNLGEAIELASKIPADQLESIVTARLYQIKPDLEQQQQLQQQIEEMSPEQVSNLFNFSNVQWQDDLDLKDFL